MCVQGGQSPGRSTRKADQGPSQALDSEKPYTSVSSAVPMLSVLLALLTLFVHNPCIEGIVGTIVLLFAFGLPDRERQFSINEQILFVLRCWKPTEKKWWHLHHFFADKAAPPILLIESSHLSWVDWFGFRERGISLRKGIVKCFLGGAPCVCTCVCVCVCVCVIGEPWVKGLAPGIVLIW